MNDLVLLEITKLVCSMSTEEIIGVFYKLHTRINELTKEIEDLKGSKI